MKKEEGDEFSFELAPINFFDIFFCCREVGWEPTGTLPRRLACDKYLLPSCAELCAEVAFAECFLGWSVAGLVFHAAVRVPFRRAVYPEVSRGDSVELFVDTRDLKTSSYNTRFCHHFFFFAEPLEGRSSGELTHFRSEEEAHPLAHDDLLVVHSSTFSEGYHLTALIPAAALVGYDPKNFQRLGFSYRINRSSGPPQHLSVLSSDFQITQQPALWSHLELVE